MPSTSFRLLAGFVSTLAFAPLPASEGPDSGDWPHWRGPSRNGVVSQRSGYTDDQKTGDPWKVEKRWKIQVGAGSSSPIVVRNSVYVMGSGGGQETLYCLDARSGRTLWKRSYRAPSYGRNSTGDKGSYSGVSATPEYDADGACLFTLGIDGDLHCWDTRRKGRKVWGLNLHERYTVPRRSGVGKGGRTQRDYGYTTSPLVVGRCLIVEAGAKHGNLIGLDKKSGKELWRSACHDEAGHSGGPVPITVGGVPCVTVLTLRNLHVARIDRGHEGETVALYPWATEYANNIPTPTVQGNEVLVTSAYNRYAMCKLRISLRGAKRVWERDNPSGVCSPVVHGGYVYWAWRGVHAVDFETGRELWRGGKVGSTGSCIVTGDDRLVVWANRGDLLLVDSVRRCPEKYRELSRKRGLVSGDAWPHVVLAGGRLFLKDRTGTLRCFRTGD